MEHKPRRYLSFDVEADGPSPCKNSMMSLGVCLLKEDKTILHKWEWNFFPLKGHETDPDTMDFWGRNPEAYQYCILNQQDAMEVFKLWNTELLEIKKQYVVKPIAHPAAYDWQWINYYFAAAGLENPLGYTAFCISTFIKSLNPNKSLEWDEDFDNHFNDPEYKHTHKPLDDALEQGMKFLNALEYHHTGVMNMIHK